MSLPKKSGGITRLQYEFKKVTGTVTNLREMGTRENVTGYRTILVRDENGRDHVLENITISNTLDPLFHSSIKDAAKVTLWYVAMEGNAKKGKTAICIAAVTSAEGQTYSNIPSVYKFSKSARAQVRLQYARFCQYGVPLTLFVIGIPIFLYGLVRLLTLQVPLLSEDYCLSEFQKIGLQAA